MEQVALTPRDNARKELHQLAQSLPNAVRKDFTRTEMPRDVPADLLKVIEDPALRFKLVQAGLAVGIQRQQGPVKAGGERAASILRIYPNFDAPRAERISRPTGPRKTQSKQVRYPYDLLKEFVASVESASSKWISEEAPKLDAAIKHTAEEIATAVEIEEITRYSQALSLQIQERQSLKSKVLSLALQEAAADARFRGMDSLVSV